MLNLFTDLYFMVLTAGADDPPGDDPPADDPPADDPPDEDDPPDDKDEKVPIADLRKIRAEAAKYRKQLRTLEAKVDESAKTQEKAAAQAEIDKLDGLEKEQALTAEANKRLAEANAIIAQRDDRIKAQAIGTAVYSAANAAGFASPEDAGALLESQLSDIEVTDGEVDPEEINDLVNTLAESKSYLLKGDTEDESNNVGPTNPVNMKGVPKAKFTGTDEIQKLKKQANEGMAKGNMNSAISLYNQAWEKEHGVKPPGG